MKSSLISFYLLALNVLVSANPLIKRVAYDGTGGIGAGPFGPGSGGSLKSPAPSLPDGDDDKDTGIFCGVQLVSRPSLLEIFDGRSFVHSEILNSTSLLGK